MSRPDPLVGVLLSGKYKVLQKIGFGGMSVVYKAKDELLDRFVAIKVLSTEIDENSLARFKREGMAAGKLDNPHIMNVFELFVAPNQQPYLVMDYVDGIPLSLLITREGRLSLRRATHIILQAAEALQHAHSRGIVHRDIKPSNILIMSTPSNKEFVKIVDFGIAKLKQVEEDSQGLTGTGQVVGSPMYMSPEQCMGLEVDARSDIYSLGCVFYEMLCGEPPFVGDNVLQTMRKHIDESPRPLESVITPNSVPPAVEEILMRCLEKDVKLRYQNLRDFIRNLNAAVEGKAKPIRPSVRKGPSWLQPGLLFLAIIFLLAAAGMALSIKRQWGPTLRHLLEGTPRRSAQSKVTQVQQAPNDSSPGQADDNAQTLAMQRLAATEAEEKRLEAEDQLEKKRLEAEKAERIRLEAENAAAKKLLSVEEREKKMAAELDKLEKKEKQVQASELSQKVPQKPLQNPPARQGGLSLPTPNPSVARADWARRGQNQVPPGGADLNQAQEDAANLARKAARSQDPQEITKAESAVTKALADINRHAPNSMLAARALTTLGSLKGAEGDFRTAESLFAQALDVSAKNGNPGANALYHYGHLLVTEGKFREAEAMLRRSIASCNNRFAVKTAHHAFDELAHMYTRMGKPELASEVKRQEDQFMQKWTPIERGDLPLSRAP